MHAAERGQPLAREERPDAPADESLAVEPVPEEDPARPWVVVLERPSRRRQSPRTPARAGSGDEVVDDPGARLRRARRARRLDLARASADTCIKARYLEALEEGAGPEAFPGIPYARGFLREYARYLGLDPEPLLRSHPATRDGLEPPSLALVPVPEVEPPSRRTWMAVAAASIALLAGLIALGRAAERNRPAPEAGARLSPPAASPSAPAASGVGAGVSGVPLDDERVSASDRPATGITLVVGVGGERCWVRAVVDGRQLLAETLRPGQTRTIEAARQVDLTLGNARAVRLMVNGKPLALPPDATVVRLTLVLENGQVRAVVSGRETRLSA
jgi:cytoskeleton protein RodZ